MRELLRSATQLAFLDTEAARFLAEARRAYRDLDLDRVTILDAGAQVRVLTWLGDAANEVLVFLLLRRGITASLAGPGIDVMKAKNGVDAIQAVLAEAANGELPALADLMHGASNLEREKWDWALPPALLHTTYASLRLDLGEAQRWLALNQKQFRQP
jgi:ATP-dependent Lhr-like helicase